MGELEKEGLMQPAGLEAFARRSEEKSRIYAYEQRDTATLEAHHLKKLQANKKAWTFFQAQPPWYRRVAVYRVVSAKKEETKLKRLTLFIELWAQGKRE